MHEKSLHHELDLSDAAPGRDAARAPAAPLDETVALELCQRLARSADPARALASLRATDPRLADCALEALARTQGRSAAEHLARRAAAAAPAAPPSAARSPVAGALALALREPGGVLPRRAELERFFGTPLGDVAVHRGPAAHAAARALGAEAFAIGDHVVLGDREPDAGLLAEETAHAVQQRGARLPALEDVGHIGEPEVLAAHDALEHTARAAAAAFASGATRAPQQLGRGTAAIAMRRSGESAPSLDEAAGAAAELVLSLAGKRLPIDPSRIFDGKLKLEAGAFSIPGLHFAQVCFVGDPKAGDLTGKLEGTLDLAPHLVAPFHLAIDKGGAVSARFEGELKIPGLVDTTMDFTVGAQGLSGRATAAHGKGLAAELGDGIAVQSGSLSLSLAPKRGLAAQGRLVLTAPPLQRIELDARVALPPGTAFDGSQLSGRVRATVTEAVALGAGAEVTGARLEGSWSGRSFSAVGGLDVELTGFARAGGGDVAATQATGAGPAASIGVYGSYLWSPQKKGFSGLGTVSQHTPLPLAGSALGTEVRVERGRYSVSIVDDAIAEVSGHAWLSAGAAASGEVAGSYDVARKQFTGGAEVTLGAPLVLPGGLELLGAGGGESEGGATLRVTVVDNAPVELGGALRMRLAVGGAHLELVAEDAVCDLKRETVSGTVTVRVAPGEDLRIGSPDGLHLVLAQGAEVRGTLEQNALVSLDAALAFALRQGEAPVAAGEVSITFDAEGGLGGDGWFELSKPLGLPGPGGALELDGSGKRFTFSALQGFLEQFEFPTLDVSLASLVALLRGLLDGVGGGGRALLDGGAPSGPPPRIGMQWPDMPAPSFPNLDGLGEGLGAALGALRGKLSGLWKALSGAGGGAGARTGDRGGGGGGGGGLLDLLGQIFIDKPFEWMVPLLGKVRFGDGSPMELDLDFVKNAVKGLKGKLPFGFRLALPKGGRAAGGGGGGEGAEGGSLPLDGELDGGLTDDTGAFNPWGSATLRLTEDIELPLGARDQLVLRGGEKGASIGLKIDKSGPGPVALDFAVDYLRDGKPMFRGQAVGLALDLGTGKVGGTIRMSSQRPLERALDAAGEWRVVVPKGAAVIDLVVADSRLSALANGIVTGQLLEGTTAVAAITVSGVSLGLDEKAAAKQQGGSGSGGGGEGAGDAEAVGLSGQLSATLSRARPLVSGGGLEATLIGGVLTAKLGDGALERVDAALIVQATRDGQALGVGQANGTFVLKKAAAGPTAGTEPNPTAASGAVQAASTFDGALWFELTAPYALHPSQPGRAVTGADREGPASWTAELRAGSRIELTVSSSDGIDNEVSLAALFRREGLPIAHGKLEGSYDFGEVAFAGKVSLTTLLPTPLGSMAESLGHLGLDTVVLSPGSRLEAQLSNDALEGAQATFALVVFGGGRPRLRVVTRDASYSAKDGLSCAGAKLEVLAPLRVSEAGEGGGDYGLELLPGSSATVAIAKNRLTGVEGELEVVISDASGPLLLGGFDLGWSFDPARKTTKTRASAQATLLRRVDVPVPGTALSIALLVGTSGTVDVVDGALDALRDGRAVGFVERGGTKVAAFAANAVSWAPRPGQEGHGNVLAADASALLLEPLMLPLPSRSPYTAQLGRGSQLSIALRDSQVQQVGGTLVVDVQEGGAPLLRAKLSAKHAPVDLAATVAAGVSGVEAPEPVLEGTVAVTIAEGVRKRLFALPKLDGAVVMLEGGAHGEVDFEDGRVKRLGGNLALTVERGKSKLATIEVERLDVPLGEKASEGEGEGEEKDSGISGTFRLTLEAERVALRTLKSGEGHEIRLALRKGTSGEVTMKAGELVSLAGTVSLEVDLPKTDGTRITVVGTLGGAYSFEDGIQSGELEATLEAGSFDFALPKVPFPDAASPMALKVLLLAGAKLKIGFGEGGVPESFEPSGPILVMPGEASSAIAWGEVEEGTTRVEKKKGGGWEIPKLGLDLSFLGGLGDKVLRLGKWLAAKITGLVQALIQHGADALQWIIDALRFEPWETKTEAPPAPPEESGGRWQVLLDLLSSIVSGVIEGLKVAYEGISGALRDGLEAGAALLSGALKLLFDALRRFKIGGGGGKKKKKKSRKAVSGGGDEGGGFDFDALGWPDLALEITGGSLGGELDDNALASLEGSLQVRLLSAGRAVAAGELTGTYDVAKSELDGALSLVSSEPYVFPLGEADGDGGPLSGWMLLLPERQGIELTMAKNALGSATGGLEVELHSGGDGLVATASLRGAYDFAQPDAGYSGGASFAVVGSPVLVAGERFALRLAGGGGDLELAGSTITHGAGSLTFDLLEHEEAKGTVAGNATYANGELGGALTLALSNSIELARAGGYVVSLAAETGGAVEIGAAGVERISGLVALSVADARTEAELANGRFALAPYRPDSGVGPSASGLVTLSEGLELTPPSLADTLTVKVTSGAALVTLKEGVLVGLIGDLELLIGPRGGGAVATLTAQTRWAPGADGGLRLDGKLALDAAWPLPERLGGRLLPQHQLVLAPESSCELHLDTAGDVVRLDGGVTLWLDREMGPAPMGRWLEVGLEGGVSASSDASSMWADIKARLLKRVPLATAEGGWKAYLESGTTQFDASLHDGALVAAHGSVDVGIDDALGKLLRASSEVDWDSREDVLKIGPSTLEILREKVLGEVAGKAGEPYAVVLEAGSGLGLELEGVVPRKLTGDVKVRLDQPYGVPFARLTMAGGVELTDGGLQLEGTLEVELLRTLEVLGKRGAGHWLEVEPGAGLHVTFAQGVPRQVNGALAVIYGEGEVERVEGTLTGSASLDGAASFSVKGAATVLAAIDVARTPLGTVSLVEGSAATVELTQDGLKQFAGTVWLGLRTVEDGSGEQVRIGLEDAEYSAVGGPDGGPSLRGTGTLEVRAPWAVYGSETRLVELHPGTALRATLADGQVTAAESKLVVVYYDADPSGALTPLVAGEVQGTIGFADESFSGSGTLALARELEFALGDVALSLKPPTRGTAHFADGALQSLSGSMVASMAHVEQGWTLEVAAEGSLGPDERGATTLLEASGSATLTNGSMRYFDEHLEVTSLTGSFGWANGALERVSGGMAFGLEWGAQNETAGATTPEGKSAAGSAFQRLAGAGTMSWRKEGDEDRFSGAGSLAVDVPGTLSAELAASFEEDGRFDIRGSGTYWLNEIISGSIGMQIDEQWDPVIDGTLQLSNLELMGEHELFSIHKPELIKGEFGAVIVVVPVAGVAGAGLGLAVRTKPLVLNAALEARGFRPLSMVAPRIESVSVGLSTGLEVDAILTGMIGAGLGIPGCQVGVGASGELTLTLSTDASIAATLESDEQKGFAGSLDVDLGISLAGSATLKAVAYYIAGQLGTVDLASWPLELGELFDFDWATRLPFGSDERLPGKASNAQPPVRLSSATEVESEPSFMEGTVTERLDAALPSDHPDGRVSGGVKVPAGEEVAKQSSASGIDDLGQVGDSKWLDEIKEYGELVEKLKVVYEQVDAFVSVADEAGFWPFGTTQGYALAVLYYAYMHFFTDEWDLKRDFLTPVKEAWALIKKLKLIEKAGDFMREAVRKSKEYFDSNGEDLDALLQRLISTVQAKVKKNTKDAWIPLVDEIFRALGENLTAITKIFEYYEDPNLISLDGLITIATGLGISALDIVRLTGATAHGVRQEARDRFGDTAVDLVEWGLSPGLKATEAVWDYFVD